METRDILTIVGWPVSCLLSGFVGGWLIPRLAKKKKILLWAVISESDLISREIHQQLSLPVSIKVDGATRNCLSLVRVRLGNAGNEVIETVEPAIRFNSGASLLYIKPRGDLGEYQKCIEGKIEDDRAKLAFSHINPGFACEFDLLLSDYEAGSLTVDVAASGVTLLRRDPMRWTATVSPFQNLGLNFFGLNYDPQTSHIAEVALELKAIRKMLQSKGTEKTSEARIGGTRPERAE